MEKDIKSPLVSIIMPLYNAEKYVTEAIESVLAQTYQNWELIVVNDGSTDDSLLVAKKFESNKIKIYNIHNAGAAGARNYGYCQSKGIYIKFFDSDDIINSLMLDEQVNLANQHTESIISGKWGRFYNDDITTFKLSPEECWQNMKPVDWICSNWKYGQCMTQPGTFLIPKNIIEKAGIWNDKLSLNDDFEYFTKTMLASQKIIFCNCVTLFYRSGQQNALSGQKSRKAVESAFLSLKQGTEKLLSVENSTLTKLCSANVWQNFIYEFYYSQPDLAKQAELKIKQLGGSNLDFPCGGYTEMLSKVVGWKVAKWVREKL